MGLEALIERPSLTRARADSGRDGYTPPPEQLVRFNGLKSVVSLLESDRVEYSVTGGFGLDGLAGHLTRDHSDIDLMLRSESDRIRVDRGLKARGFLHKLKKASGTDVYMDAATDSVMIEMKSWQNFAPHLGENKDRVELFFQHHNAFLNGLIFNTCTVEGHAIYWEAQKRRCAEEEWNEDDVHAGSRQELIDDLRKKQNT